MATFQDFVVMPGFVGMTIGAWNSSVEYDPELEFPLTSRYDFRSAYGKTGRLLS
jgi:hypothetical protein